MKIVFYICSYGRYDWLKKIIESLNIGNQNRTKDIDVYLCMYIQGYTKDQVDYLNSIADQNKVFIKSVPKYLNNTALGKIKYDCVHGFTDIVKQINPDFVNAEDDDYEGFYLYQDDLYDALKVAYDDGGSAYWYTFSGKVKSNIEVHDFYEHMSSQWKHWTYHTGYGPYLRYNQVNLEWVFDNTFKQLSFGEDLYTNVKLVASDYRTSLITGFEDKFIWSDDDIHVEPGGMNAFKKDSDFDSYKSDDPDLQYQIDRWKKHPIFRRYVGSLISGYMPQQVTADFFRSTSAFSLFARQTRRKNFLEYIKKYVRVTKDGIYRLPGYHLDGHNQAKEERFHKLIQKLGLEL